MTLNEAQTASVCQAYCAMQDLQDTAARVDMKCSVMLDSDGSLFFSPGYDVPHPGMSCFLRNVKDRTAKEIDSFVNDWRDWVEAAAKAVKADRIAKLKAELAALTEPVNE